MRFGLGKRLIALISILAALSLVSCGGSEPSAQKADKRPSTTTDSDKRSSPTTDSGESEKELKFQGDPDSKFCNLIRGFDEFEQSTDPTDVATMYTGLLARAKELQSNAPSEVRKNVDSYVTALSSVVDRLTSANWDTSVLDSGDGIDPEAIRENMDVLFAYSSQVCGIEESE